MLWQAISWLNRKTEATYRFVPVASARSSISAAWLRSDSRLAILAELHHRRFRIRLFSDAPFKPIAGNDRLSAGAREF
jgi:hypothetical protein